MGAMGSHFRHWYIQIDIQVYIISQSGLGACLYIPKLSLTWYFQTLSHMLLSY